VGRSFRYTPFYCEENVWQLAREERFLEHETLAVIISGRGPSRRLWYQRNALHPALPVHWDYHLVLLSYNDGWQVWDLDTTLELPVPVETYVHKTFLQANVEAGNTDVILRLIPVGEFVRDFSSDRSHMELPSGEWAAPPPEWPMIMQGAKSNLLDWLDIDRDGPGQVLTLVEFMTAFILSPPVD